MNIKIGPKRIAIFLTVIFLVLLFSNVALNVARYYCGFHSIVVSAFNFGSEHNLPTYYSSVTLLFCGILLAVVAVAFKKKRQKYAVHWSVLSALFVYLSLDEMLEIHEQIVKPLQAKLHTRGMLRYPWVIPFGILLVIFVLSYSGFLKNLPNRIRTLFIVSGTIYVLGAMGIEMLGGRCVEIHGWDNFGYAMYQTVEESFEMLGTNLFAYAIATCIKNHIKNVTIEVD
jgi:hypothetical protein